MEKLTARSWAMIGLGSAALAAASKAFMMTTSSKDERVQRALDSIASNDTLHQALGAPAHYQTKWPRVQHYADSDGVETIDFKMTCPNGTASVSFKDSKLTMDCSWNNQRYLMDSTGVVTEAIAAPSVVGMPDTFRYVGNFSVLVATGLGLFSAWRFNKRGGLTGMRLIKTARAHPVVQDIFGNNVKLNGRMIGRISPEIVNVRIPLKGSKTQGTVILQGIRTKVGETPFQWNYTYAAVEDSRKHRTPIQL